MKTTCPAELQAPPCYLGSEKHPTAAPETQPLTARLMLHIRTRVIAEKSPKRACLHSAQVDV